MADLEDYRRGVRSWLEEHAARHHWLRGDGRRYDRLDNDTRLRLGKECQRLLHDAGYAGITWPREYGGQGLSNREQVVFNQEASAYDLPLGIFVIGLGMCGPTVLAVGSEAQKQRYLPPMLRGDEIWCQMFSEPGAGSDLAAVETRAVRDGDQWVLRGQKVWTSAAQYARYGIILCRTDPDVPKHAGLTMFVLDMTAPGVTVRPLRQMNGMARFNEVFLDDVVVGGGDVVGEVNRGWQAALATLMSERVAIGAGRPSGDAHDADTLIAAARATGRARNPVLRQRLADVYARERLLRWLGQRVTEAVLAGRPPGPEGSLAKLAGSQLAKRSADVGVALHGSSALAWQGGDGGGHWADVLLLTPGLSIAGGTDEVLRNVIGERVLGLPKDADVSKDVPFRELQRS